MADERLGYGVLYYRTLLRERDNLNSINLSRYNWNNNDLIIIDEANNFRNGLQGTDDEKDNRYSMLLNKIINSGHKTNILMLSATPVNNSFNDLKNKLNWIVK